MRVVVSIYIALAVLIYCITTASAEIQCSISGPSRNGGTRTVDLSPLTKQASGTGDPFYKADDVYWDWWEYRINPCAETLSCNQRQYSSLRWDKETYDCTGIGELSTQTLSLKISNDINAGVELKMSTTDGYATIVDFVCEEGTGVGTFKHERTEMYTHYFKWITEHACPKKSSGGRIPVLGVGGLILIIVFALIIAYFVIAILINKYAYHKQGKDVIPHLEFLKDFPVLVKEGMMYAWSGISGLFGKREYTQV